jgi:hypothetical protein
MYICYVTKEKRNVKLSNGILRIQIFQKRVQI